MKPAKHAMTVALVALVVSACGFQLRGASPVPSALEPLWIGCHDGVPTGLCRAIKSRFAIGDVKLSGSRQEAAYLLLLGDFRQNQRTSAISSRAEAAEYELRQTVSMALQTTAGVPLLSATDISAAQSYRFDATGVLATRHEQDEIERQLHDSLARQISYRLVAFDQERINTILQADNSQQAAP